MENNQSGRISGNSRNGHEKKKVSGSFGEIELKTPRDRQSTLEPPINHKRSTKLGMIDNAILSLYAKGMTVRDIQATLLEGNRGSERGSGRMARVKDHQDHQDICKTRNMDSGT